MQTDTFLGRLRRLGQAFACWWRSGGTRGTAPAEAWKRHTTGSPERITINKASGSGTLYKLDKMGNKLMLKPSLTGWGDPLFDERSLSIEFDGNSTKLDKMLSDFVGEGQSLRDWMPLDPDLPQPSEVISVDSQGVEYADTVIPSEASVVTEPEEVLYDPTAVRRLAGQRAWQTRLKNEALRLKNKAAAERAAKKVAAAHKRKKAPKAAAKITARKKK